MPTVVSIAVFLHVTAVAAWVGGMAFAHFALRPAVQALDPPQRLPLMAETLRRFFAIVTVAVVVVVASGFVLVESVGGFGRAGIGVHAMVTFGLLMTAIYAYVRVVPFRELRAAVAERKWPDAAAALGRVRAAVVVNLALGVLTIAVATLPR